MQELQKVGMNFVSETILMCIALGSKIQVNGVKARLGTILQIQKKDFNVGYP